MTKILDEDIRKAVENNSAAIKEFLCCCAEDTLEGNDCLVALMRFMGCEDEDQLKDIFTMSKDTCHISLEMLKSYVDIDTEKKKKMSTCDYVVFEDCINTINRSTTMYKELSAILKEMAEVRNRSIELKKFLEK